QSILRVAPLRWLLAKERLEICEGRVLWPRVHVFHLEVPRAKHARLRKPCPDDDLALEHVEVFPDPPDCLGQAERLTVEGDVPVTKARTGAALRCALRRSRGLPHPWPLQRPRGPTEARAPRPQDARAPRCGWFPEPRGWPRSARAATPVDAAKHVRLAIHAGL